jgi:hypothetical protein
MPAQLSRTPVSCRRAPSDLVALFSYALNHGCEFHPWLVAKDGKIVGYVPGPVEAGLMKVHLIRRERLKTL